MGDGSGSWGYLVNPSPLGWTYPDQGPTLVEPMDEKGTFSFSGRRNQDKCLGWSMLRTEDADS